MWERNTSIDGMCRCAGVALHAAWDIEADATYDIHWPEEKDAPIYPNSYTACYTLSGTGTLYLRDGTRIELSPDSLLFVKNENVHRYCCVHDNWRFHWVEFSASSALALPVEKQITLPNFDMYSHSFYEVIQALRQGTPAYKRLAAATFEKLLYEWLVLCENEQIKHPHRATIQGIINEMHCRVGENWTVQDMAKQAKMSEPNFRKCFLKITGQSPKKFYNQIRMSLAEALLNKGTYSISEISDQLGFADPFHFSKAFKRHAGAPPSTFRNRK
jgi:AraC-like DNA-binding protein